MRSFLERGNGRRRAYLPIPLWRTLAKRAIHTNPGEITHQHATQAALHPVWQTPYVTKVVAMLQVIDENRRNLRKVASRFVCNASEKKVLAKVLPNETVPDVPIN